MGPMEVWARSKGDTARPQGTCHLVPSVSFFLSLCICLSFRFPPDHTFHSLHVSGPPLMAKLHDAAQGFARKASPFQVKSDRSLSSTCIALRQSPASIQALLVSNPCLLTVREAPFLDFFLFSANSSISVSDLRIRLGRKTGISGRFFFYLI